MYALVVKFKSGRVDRIPDNKDPDMTEVTARMFRELPEVESATVEEQDGSEHAQ